MLISVMLIKKTCSLLSHCGDIELAILAQLGHARGCLTTPTTSYKHIRLKYHDRILATISTFLHAKNQADMSYGYSDIHV